MRTNMVKICTLSGLLVCTQGFCQDKMGNTAETKKATRIKQLFNEIEVRINEMALPVTEQLLKALLKTDTPLTSRAQKLEVCKKSLEATNEDAMRNIKVRIDDAVKSIEKKEPQTLTAEDEFGLTPAHELALILNRYIEFEKLNIGTNRWIGQDYYLDLAYAYLLSRIDSGKKVLAKKPPMKVSTEKNNPRAEQAALTANTEISSKYEVLEKLGITKTKMSPTELMKQAIETNKDQWPKIWEQVWALKLA